MLVLGAAGLVTVLVGGFVVLVALLWPRVDPAPSAGRTRMAGGRGDTADRVTILGVGAAPLGVALSATSFGILLLLVRTHTGFAAVDVGPARWAARHATTASTDILRALTFLGSTVAALILLTVVGALEYRRLPNRVIPAFLAAVEGGQLLLHNLVKVLVGRARPGYDQLVGASGLSFPSGHATNAAATFAAVVLLLGRRRNRNTCVVQAGMAAGTTALVSSTRVLLGVHWVTDVLAGVALGWGWAALCSIVLGSRLLRFAAPRRVRAGPGATTPSPPGEESAPAPETFGSS